MMKLLKLPTCLLSLLLPLIFTLLLSPAYAREEDPVRYVVTLETSREPLEETNISLAGTSRTYVTSFRRRGETLYRLRLGFFASRQEAEKVLPLLSSEYPSAWVTRVSKREKRQVMTGQIKSQPSAIKTAGNRRGN